MELLPAVPAVQSVNVIPEGIRKIFPKTDILPCTCILPECFQSCAVIRDIRPVISVFAFVADKERPVCAKYINIVSSLADKDLLAKVIRTGRKKEASVLIVG